MSNTTELPISVERCRRFVKGCSDSGEGTVLWVGDGVGIFLAVRTDLAAARRVAGAFRRVDRVGIVLHDVGPGDAVVHAVGHRLPVHRRISMSAALGLARLGVPTVVETTAGESS